MPKILAVYEFAPAVGPGQGTRRRDGTTTDWWLILRCERDLGSYLRRLYCSDSPAAGAIQEPLWGPHVSVVQDEMPPNMAHWRDREGAEVELEYTQDPQESNGYVYMPVRCEVALDYRELLGLPRQPRFPLHLTIGNRKHA